VERLELSAATRGSDLQKHALAYLKLQTERLEEETTQELVRAIRLASPGQVLPLAESEWVRLSDAALTIGSNALDRITRRLSILGSSTNGSADFDYRPLATQIHALARPARKIRNAIAHRAKCVRAVMKPQQSTDNQSQGWLLAQTMRSNESEVMRWERESFEVFAVDATVSPRFHSTYLKEWELFCTEWNAFNFDGRQRVEEGLSSIYEKNLHELSKEASKFNLQWIQSKPDFVQKLSDSAEPSSVTYEIKRKQEQFTITISIPELTQQKYNRISMDLMDLIESETGLTHIDALRGGKDSHLLNIEVYGTYSREQLKLAVSKVEEYFQKNPQ
jgi:hypothetical protein